MPATLHVYHTPLDRVEPDWDMSGAVQDLQYYWMVGYKVAQAGKYPQWKPGTEFKATRAAQLKAAGGGQGVILPLCVPCSAPTGDASKDRLAAGAPHQECQGIAGGMVAP